MDIVTTFWPSFILMLPSKNKKLKGYFPEVQVEEEGISAINLNSLIGRKRWSEIWRNMSPTLQVLGPKSNLIIAIFMFLTGFFSYYIVFELLVLKSLVISVALFCLILAWGYQFLKARRRKNFEQTFPDALNILMSAVTAGESLMQVFDFVGENMDGEVGREFREMSDRLKLGEDAELVLQRSCRAFPYPEYIFFTITIRANLSRGGQLKNVLARLIRVLFDARTIERKKMAMTSEARISAKIVAAIPVAFVIMLSQIHPENIDYILYDPKGQWILFYVLGSELLGLFVVWLLVKRVKL